MAEEHIKVDSAATELNLKELAGKVKNPKPVLKAVHVDMMGKTDKTFKALAHGGTYRGVTWRPFAASSIGRRRPSGKIITMQSNLLRDTGRMAAAAGQSQVWADGGFTLHMTTKGAAIAKYAPRQQAMRPFLFYEVPQDSERAAQITKDYIDGKWGAAKG